MAIEVKQQTPEQKQQEQNQVEKTAQSVADEIVKGLDLSTFPNNQEVAEEEVTENETEEQPETQTEDETETDSTQEADDSEDPKSKRVQERIDELTREKKQLEARLKKLESQSSTKQNSDPDMEKLEAMSVEELRNIKKNVLRAQRTADPAKLDELFELEEKVAKAIDTAPQRFQSQQIERFNAVLENSVSSIPNFDKVKNEIYDYAKNIYGRSASMQKSVDGQAEAWLLAVDHFSALQKLSVDKSKTKDLERKVNDLKKKTSLSTAVQRGVSSSSDEAKLFNKAKAGSMDDKLAFFKKRVNMDSLIDKELLR